MAWFDIPTILQILRPTDNWGPNAGSNSTYTLMASTWIGPGTVPTLSEMNAVAATLTQLPTDRLQMWQIQSRLDTLNQFNTVNASINGTKNTDPTLYRQWLTGGTFTRTGSFVTKLTAILGYTSQQMDQFFVDCSSLT